MAELTALKPGDRARVQRFHDDSPYAKRLKSLGLIAGTEFVVARRAPLGDPVEIRYRGFSLALRPDEAKCLDVEAL